MTLHEYLQGMKGKTAAVIGLGVSNRPLVELLARNGVKVIACDRKERAALGDAAAHYEALGAVLHLGEGYLRDLDADVVFRTPGMRPDVPELLEAKAHGAVITSEMEAFFAVCPCPIIGVTGSDGKTTTASVIAELLKAEGRRVWLGGNIGRPLLADAEQMTPDDLAVLELSSFQLMDMPYSPQVAVLTNLAPNHLDVHRDMAEYIASKENIYLHQSARDTAIFNADNAITRDLSGKAVGRARLFSRPSLLAKNPVTPSSTVPLYASTSLATIGTPRAVNSMYFNSLLHLLNSVLTNGIIPISQFALTDIHFINVAIDIG